MRRVLGVLLPLLLLLVSSVSLAYPVVATVYNNDKQTEFSAQYNKNVATIDPTERARILDEVATYNAKLRGIPILDPYLSHIRIDQNSDYQGYLRQLGELPVMARLRVPSVDIDLPVYHGTSDETIAKGVGHLYGTSLPVGGNSTHAVLASHTGMANATLFDHLVDVKDGDQMFVDVLGETLTYQVDSIKVVLPDQVEDLAGKPDRDLLTLLTCTPYAVNTHRLLVTGHRVPTSASATSPGTGTRPALSTTHVAMLGGSALFMVLFWVLLSREVRAVVRRRRAHVLHQNGVLDAPSS